MKCNWLPTVTDGNGMVMCRECREEIHVEAVIRDPKVLDRECRDKDEHRPRGRER
jgi:hypothetical protein